MKAALAIGAGFLLAWLAAGCASGTDKLASGAGPDPAHASGGAPEAGPPDAPAPHPSTRPLPPSRDEPAPAHADETLVRPPVAEEPRTVASAADPVSPEGFESSPGGGTSNVAEPSRADDAPGPGSSSESPGAGASAVAEPSSAADGAPGPGSMSESSGHAGPATGEATRSREPAVAVRPTRSVPRIAPAFLLAFESRDSRIEMPVDVPALERECDVQGEATVEGLRLSLLRYAPSVSIHESIVRAPAGDDGFLALHIVLETPARRDDTWLVPGSRVFGKAAFPAARVECLPSQTAAQLAATRDLLKRMQSPGAKILLEVKSDGRRLLYAAREGEVIRITDPDYVVTVERIFGNFALDPKTGQAHDVGSRPFNPAVQARIEHGGRTRTAWLFSQLPAFSREAEDEHGLFSLLYPVPDPAHQRAEITVVDDESGPSPVFLARGRELHEGVIAPSGATRLAGVTIGIPERITRARIKQTVQADPQGRPAVLLAWRGAEREGTRWIPLGAELELRCEGAVFFARLLPGRQFSPGRSPHGGPVGAPGDRPLKARADHTGAAISCQSIRLRSDLERRGRNEWSQRRLRPRPNENRETKEAVHHAGQASVPNTEHVQSAGRR